MTDMRMAARPIVLAAMMGVAACAPGGTAQTSPGLGFLSQGPSYGTNQRYCDRSSLSDVFSTSTGSVLGTAAGAAAGGLIGSQFGKGSGSTAMTIGGVLAGALVGGVIARAMEPVDQACIDQALEHTPTNESIEWQNPDNRSSYWVTPTRTTVLPDGTPCRYYTTEALVDGQREAQTGYACRQADGTWKNLR